MTSSAFRLTKWYADALDSHGRGLIAYEAALQWNAIRLGYRGTISIHIDGLKDESNWLMGKEIEHPAGDFQWKSGDKAYAWKGSRGAISEMLLQSEEGSVQWNCLQPGAQVTGSNLFHAHGYVEKIELTLLPWNLPISELYWGRYISDKHCIIWIRWEGSKNLQLVWMNGVRLLPGSISQTEIRVDEYQVGLPNQLLRKGSLMESVFARFEKMTRWFPSNILSLYEEKWYGNAALTHRGVVVDEGQVIHEKVKWP